MKKTQNASKRQTKVSIDHILEITNILRQQNDIILELRTDNSLMKQNLVTLNEIIIPTIQSK